jgi:exopolyphosphatase/guanosine-5'-triphosphate,3'-diphosphate pyrophosphatase
MATTRVAAIDIGTNSVLMLVAERQGDDIVRVQDLATITRLGEGVDETGKLADAAIERTLSCLTEYAATLQREGAQHVGAVGTSAMRDASGGTEFVARATAVLGVAPEVISGQREAELTFDGALTALDTSGRVAVFDIGGGSTEIIVGTRVGAAATLEDAVSLDIGAVRLTERHLKTDPPTTAEIESVRSDVRKALEQAPSIRDVPLVGVAGTITTLAAVAKEIVPYDGNAVHGSTLTRGDLTQLLAKLAACTVAERRKIPGLHPKRADVIIAGTVIAEVICERANAARMVVSDRGVRWGLAKELARST